MDQNLFEKIEAYLQNALDPEEKAAFEQQLDRDPELKKEVDLQLELANAIETDAMQAALDRIHEQQFGVHAGKGQGRLIRRLRPLAVAASVALLVIAGWWIFGNSPNSNGDLYAQYYETPPGLPTNLGLEDQTNFNEGMVDYKLGNFTAALEQWRPLLDSFPQNDTLRFFIGITYLETSTPDSAAMHLRQVQAIPGSSLGEEAAWYLAMVLFKDGKNEEAFSVLSSLSEQEHPFREKAQNILKNRD